MQLEMDNVLAQVKMRDEIIDDLQKKNEDLESRVADLEMFIHETPSSGPLPRVGQQELSAIHEDLSEVASEVGSQGARSQGARSQKSQKTDGASSAGSGSTALVNGMNGLNLSRSKAPTAPSQSSSGSSYSDFDKAQVLKVMGALKGGIDTIKISVEVAKGYPDATSIKFFKAGAILKHDELSDIHQLARDIGTETPSIQWTSKEDKKPFPNTSITEPAVLKLAYKIASGLDFHDYTGHLDSDKDITHLQEELGSVLKFRKAVISKVQEEATEKAKLKWFAKKFYAIWPAASAEAMRS
jgi:hypothetical protein